MHIGKSSLKSWITYQATEALLFFPGEIVSIHLLVWFATQQVQFFRAVGFLMSEQSKDEVASQLKSTVYLTVAKMVEEQLAKHTKNTETVVATPIFIASLVDLVYNQIVNLGEDLELFAQHANRSTVKPDDLYMVTRKNDILTKCLKEVEHQLKQHNS